MARLHGPPLESAPVGDPVAWLPASVGRAYARGAATADDLASGAAWTHLLKALDRAGAFVGAPPAPEVEHAAGYRHLMVLLAIGVDEALRRGDPYDPVLRPGSTDAVLKWGMDCPDALYLGAPVRPDAVYRVTGTRGTARYLGFQVMAGIASAANVVADDIATERDGSFALTLSAEERPGNWMPLRADVLSLVVRQFFYDWAVEEPARLSIELIEGGRPPRDAEPVGAAGIARQLGALGEFVEESVRFWAGIEDQLRTAGVNTFRAPDARTDLGGAEENVTVWGSWEVGGDDALVVELTPPPDALYWSIALGNHWWESVDYANHQSSLNGHQAVVDGDGVFRGVIAQRDPGVANWLDPAGNPRGPVIMRYVRASSAPVPTTRLVPFDRLDGALPAGTVRVDPAQRRRTIAARRAGVRRRFPR
jgi:hypothetical protein